MEKYCRYFNVYVTTDLGKPCANRAFLFITDIYIKHPTMDKIILEIRSAEGGTDAKLLVGEMKNIYIKTAKLNNLQ